MEKEKRICHLAVTVLSVELLGLGYYLVLNDIAAFSQEGAKYVESLLNFDLLVDVYTHCSRYCPTITIPILKLLDKLLPLIRDREFHKLLDRVAILYDFESSLSDRSVNIWASILLKCLKRAKTGRWLNACWKLLRHVEKYYDSAFNRLSYDTIEKLCHLSVEANRNDPSFPLVFVNAISKWIEEKIRQDGLNINCVPIIELIESIQGRKRLSEHYWTISNILNLFERENELSDPAILFFAKVLLRNRKQTDTEAWLYACWRLLTKATHYFQRGNIPYREETLGKLFILSLEANKVDERFPLDFAFESSMRIKGHIMENWEHFTKKRTDSVLTYTHTDMFILVKTVDVMLVQGRNQGRDIHQICQSIDALLQMMACQGAHLLSHWADSSPFIISLCHCMQVLSGNTCMYVLTELVELIRTTKAGMSFELYRELNAIAERFDHAELRYELAQL